MSSTLRDPLIKIKRAWTKDASRQELVDYVLPPNADPEDRPTQKICNKIPIDDGSKGIEHLVAQTLEQFKRHAQEANYDGPALFANLTKCLSGSTLRYWEQIVSHDPGYVAEEQTQYFFDQAKRHLLNKVCGHNDMRDTELFYLQHKIKKPEDMEPRKFLHRFYEILTVSLKLQGLFT